MTVSVFVADGVWLIGRWIHAGKCLRGKYTDEKGPDVRIKVDNCD
jgi:hypothetical protein